MLPIPIPTPVKQTKGILDAIKRNPSRIDKITNKMGTKIKEIRNRLITGML